MGLNQSTITLQIQSLERDLGQKLFDRSKKQIRPNQYGLMFYEMVSRQLSGIDSLYEEFLRNKNTKFLKVNIAAPYVVISHFLPPLIKKFQDHNPEVTFSIKNISSDQAVKELQRGDVDMILYPNIKVSEEFYSHTSFSSKPILIKHKDHELAKKRNIDLRDIAKHNVIRIDTELITLSLFEEAFKEFKFKTNVEFKNASWEIIKQFVKAKIGLGFISSLYLTNEDAGLVYRDLSKFFPIMEYKLITKNGGNLSKQAREFIKIMKDVKLSDIPI
jgi:DNA-binding transcriptional LysR family regulator